MDGHASARPIRQRPKLATAAHCRDRLGSARGGRSAAEQRHNCLSWAPQGAYSGRTKLAPAEAWRRGWATLGCRFYEGNSSSQKCSNSRFAFLRFVCCVRSNFCFLLPRKKVSLRRASPSQIDIISPVLYCLAVATSACFIPLNALDDTHLTERGM